MRFNHMENFTYPSGNRLDDCGLTLAELMIAIVISSFIIIVIFSSFQSQKKNYIVREQVAEMQQNIRGAMSAMTRQIRQCGFILPDGTVTVGVLNAGLNSITVTMDLDGNSSTTGNEISTYDINAGNLRLNSDNNKIIAENIVALSFAYAFDDDGNQQLDSIAGNTIWAYDKDGGGNLDTKLDATPMPYTVGYNKIRAVQIWILVEPSTPDREFTENKSYLVGNDIYQVGDPLYPIDINSRHRLLNTVVQLRNMGLE